MKKMTKQNLQTILYFDDTNIDLPLKIRVKNLDGTFEMCDVVGFHQWSDCFELSIRQTVNIGLSEDTKEENNEI